VSTRFKNNENPTKVLKTKANFKKIEKLLHYYDILFDQIEYFRNFQTVVLINIVDRSLWRFEIRLGFYQKTAIKEPWLFSLTFC
jgi:hypothetical protein